MSDISIAFKLIFQHIAQHDYAEMNGDFEYAGKKYRVEIREVKDV